MVPGQSTRFTLLIDSIDVPSAQSELLAEAGDTILDSVVTTGIRLLNNELDIGHSNSD